MPGRKKRAVYSKSPMPKDERLPYIDDADYARFTDKTVKESALDFVMSNLMPLLLLCVFVLSVSVIFTHRNMIPLVTFGLLMIMYKMVWLNV